MSQSNKRRQESINDSRRTKDIVRKRLNETNFSSTKSVCLGDVPIEGFPQVIERLCSSHPNMTIVDSDEEDYDLPVDGPEFTDEARAYAIASNEHFTKVREYLRYCLANRAVRHATV